MQKRLLLRLAILTFWFGSFGGAKSGPVPSVKAPDIVIDLARFGWTPPHFESNRDFFKDFSLAKMFAVDGNTNVIYLAEELVVAYHSKQDGKDWRSPRRMEVFFINTKDGSLLATKNWLTRPRTSIDERYDSEARIIALHDGHFLVFANGVLMLYNAKLELLKQQELRPYTQNDIWSMQAVPGGRAVFLQHASTSGQVTYLWLSSDTLEVQYQMSGCRVDDSVGSVSAAQEAVFIRSRSGIRKCDRDQHLSTVSNILLDRGAGDIRMLSSQYLGVSADSGIGVIDVDHGVVWVKATNRKYRRNYFMFGEMRPAMSGTRFAVWVAAYHKALFDDVEIKADPTILVYDIANPKSPISILFKPVSGEWDFSFSPKGEKLAIFSAGRVQSFSLD